MKNKNILKKFNIVINNEELLNIALTHSSYANEHNLTCYERLEYLGDAVLEIVCSDYLYKNTKLSEGEMSKLRSLYVCENALYEYSKEINLNNYIKVSSGTEMPNKTIIADVFESIIAVLYLEQGLEAVKELFNKLIVPYIEDKKDFLMDYKSLLQESVQPVKHNIKYEVISEKGPSNQKEFIVNVVIDNLVFGTGIGKSKKEAEQNAAKEAYNKKIK